MLSPDNDDRDIQVEATERGFNRGEFFDAAGKSCSVQESSLVTEGAIWLGPNESQDGLIETPNRMHLTADEFLRFLGPLKKFAESGELPAKPFTFQDRYCVPCVMSAADDGQISFGIVLPKNADKTPRGYHDTNMYVTNPDELAAAVKLLFFEIESDSSLMTDVDNRMLLDGKMAEQLIGCLHEMLVAGEDRSIEW